MPSPLQDLYKSPNDLPILSYPSDLGSSRKGHYISFTVLVPKKSNYESNPASSLASVMPPSDISSSLASTLNSVGNVATKVAEEAGTFSGIASAVSDAASTAASTVSSVASVANQALTTVNTVTGAAAGVIGSVAGVAGIATSAAGVASASGSILGGVTAATVGLSAASNLISGAGGAINSVGEFLTNSADTISNAYDSVKNFLNSPDELATDATDGLKTFALEDSGSSKFTGEFMFTPSTAKVEGFINLYMPDTVNMNQHASYADISATTALGNFGLANEFISQAKNFTSLYENISKAAESGFKGGAGETIRSIARNTPAAGLEIGGDMATKSGITGKGFSQYLLGQYGWAVNPQMEVLFTSMDFRTFQFDFTFTPKSPEEANTVRDIIRLFRYHAAPQIDSSGTGRYFIVPSIFNIEYRYLEQRNENLHKFAPCALTTVQVDYAPEVGWVAHNDGMPVKTRMTLQFKEMEILTKEKIQEGY